MTEFVSVPVPTDRVQEVYELLARQPAGPAAVAHVGEDGFPDGWNSALVERMYVESSGAMRRILESIARKSPSWVTTGEIAGASDLSPRQVVASLGPFGKRIRGRYRMARWPFDTREFVDAGVFKYSMPPKMASRILDLAAQVEEHEKASE